MHYISRLVTVVLQTVLINGDNPQQVKTTKSSSLITKFETADFFM
jgi:hypothetical protein